MPGSNIVCLMVGHRRMPPRTFLPLVMTGIVLKLAVLWAGGKLFEDQIRAFLDFIERYQWWIVIALFALTFVQSAGRLRNARCRRSCDEIEHRQGWARTRPGRRSQPPTRRATVQGWTGAPTPSESVSPSSRELRAGSERRRHGGS